MITAGCDVGSRFGKVIILKEGEILASSVVKAEIASEDTAQKALHAALEGLNMGQEEIDYIVGTGYGYGRLKIPFARNMLSELRCIALGAYSINPRVRMVIDIGGQDAKVIKVSEKGGLRDFVLNDKCASGTGRFLEDIARVLEVKMEEMGTLALRSEDPTQINNQCSVFAKSEVVSRIAEKVAVVDIAAGISEAISSRVASMVHRLNAEEEAMICGGVAKNRRVVRDLEKKIGLQLAPYYLDPQLVCALGAALYASGNHGDPS